MLTDSKGGIWQRDNVRGDRQARRKVGQTDKERSRKTNRPKTDKMRRGQANKVRLG